MFTGQKTVRSRGYLDAFEKKNNSALTEIHGPGSIVGIATGYRIDGPRIESWWGRDFMHLSRPALMPIQTPVQWVPGLFQGKERPGRDADPSPSSSAVFMKG